MKYIKRFIENKENFVKVVEVTSEHIKFDDGSKISSHHNQDCYEKHYIDFSYVNIDDFKDLEFDLDSKFFNEIPTYGIEIVPTSGWGVRIPGYGSNNGYYSSDLSLVLERPNKENKNFDITDCQDINWEA